MEAGLIIAILYGCVLNLAGLISMGLDKKRAKEGAWRIPERTLFLIAIFGGSLGSILGMQLFRHKTRHKAFVLGMPLILVIQIILCVVLLGRTMPAEARRTDFAMGTVVSEVIYGPDSDRTAEGVYQCILKLEQQELSWRAEDSAVAVWNQSLEQGTAVRLTGQEQKWLQDSLALCEDSNGALDITIHPVIDLWGMEQEQPAVPAEEALQAALADTGYERIHLSEDGMLTGESVACSIDLGAVGKGIAGDVVREYLADSSVTGAVISIGGTIVVYGDKPGTEDWTVGIQDPRGPQGTVLGTLTMRKNGIVSTSGDYEKYFTEQGTRYHHIFDPATGYPADSGLMAVTVVSDSGLISDGLSTACFVLGYQDGCSLLEQYGAEGIFVTMERQVYITEGLRDMFELTDTDYELQE